MGKVLVEAWPTSTNELLNSISDSDPFNEIYNCGKINEFKDPVKDLNRLIQKKFKGCTSLLVRK